jgi:hypothetical protein
MLDTTHEAGIALMELHIRQVAGVVTNLWITNVPEDFSDDDVRYSFQVAADQGDNRARWALESVPMWLDMRDSSMRKFSPRSRVYLDNA